MAIQDLWQSWLRESGITSLGGSAKVSLPENAEGSLTAENLTSTSGSITTYVRTFPAGLKGIKIRFSPSDFSVVPVSGICYVGFNNTALNDVTINGLRREVEIGGEVSFTFEAPVKPTQVTIAVDGVELVTGDSSVYFEAVQ